MYIDTHLDSFYAMVVSNRQFATLQDKGHVDLPRARQGGLLAGFFTGFPNCTYFFTKANEHPELKMTRDDYSDAELTAEYMARWLKNVYDPKNGLSHIKTKQDLDNHIKSYNSANKDQKIGAISTFEGAAGIDESLNQLYVYYAAGLRAIGLTWNETNQFATGVPGDVNRGLTTAGKDLLDAMESLGIVIDVSHLNDKSFWDVQSHTNKPIFASHSNLRTKASHKRNVTADMAKAIAESGGTMGINLCTSFLTDDKSCSRTTAFEMIREIIDVTGSVNHVHMGTDFDGAKMPDDIKDVSAMPGFFTDLQEYLDLSDNDMKKIQYENVVRVIKEYWK